MDMRHAEVRGGRSSPQPGPFGYAFLSSMDTPFEPAPAPPPGPALLDDNESSMLDTFFTTMNSNQLDMGDFWLGRQQNKSLGVFNLEWSDELPPTFEGSTTSLPQPTFAPPNLEKSNFGLLSNTMGTSSDILAAASMLYHQGINGADFGPAFQHQTLPSQGIIDANDQHYRQNGVGKSAQPENRPVLKDSTPQSARPRVPVGFHTTDMRFDIHQAIPLEQQSTTKPRALHWGSDISFMDQGYVAPPDQPNEEDRTKELFSNMDWFERQSSTANTRAPSPERILGAENAQRVPPTPDLQSNGFKTRPRVSTEDPSPPKKRLRVLVKEEEDDSSDGDSSRPKSKRSKGSGPTKSVRTPTDATRRPKLPPAKAVRENLSEEQKRTNHILSEQKRRNLIRQGFDDLCQLVPSLRGGGFSKSAMLTQAADWLEEVLQGNEILRSQLAELKSMNGLVMPR
ncbi:hypothetical protein ASPZODRAFT_151680 [Penicilliopsis zonata CBS 506.65]|uniref:BHLH domain-containing protein n=1 Tax=Penicilliopsis zonata CBS 506.65 TaxID=1073090 RepID=A0A1L9SJ22_9EURO|nr:hypothetical protein ASPZODRAFT_151680 [Penicilliopsis zonata CBS 506.65]OJJ47126.1 hypothetical protein ASPZODRAFT_151680 [Penicilliopsis zonata CBS 506.65]